MAANPARRLHCWSRSAGCGKNASVTVAGSSLQIPSQEIEVDAAGRYFLTYRATLAVEDYNAQISLLTGAAAARLMLGGRIGILRTLPPADPGALRRLRRTARALQIAWPDDQDYPEFVRSLDPAVPAHAAMLNACTELFRGAGYAAFDGELPEHSRHAALAIEYAHVTAPLRRLVDRFTGEVCVALCAGEPVPDWARSALPDLPDLMAAAESRAKKYERAIIDLVEVSLLHDRVGDTFTGTVIDIEPDGREGVVMVADPAVQGRVRGIDLPLGSEVTPAAGLGRLGERSGGVRPRLTDRLDDCSLRGLRDGGDARVTLGQRFVRDDRLPH